MPKLRKEKLSPWDSSPSRWQECLLRRLDSSAPPSPTAPASSSPGKPSAHWREGKMLNLDLVTILFDKPAGIGHWWLGLKLRESFSSGRVSSVPLFHHVSTSLHDHNHLMIRILAVSTFAVVLWKVGQASWVKCLSSFPERWPCNRKGWKDPASHLQSGHIWLQKDDNACNFHQSQPSSAASSLSSHGWNLWVTARYRTLAVLQGRVRGSRLAGLWMRNTRHLGSFGCSIWQQLSHSLGSFDCSTFSEGTQECCCCRD